MKAFPRYKPEIAGKDYGTSQREYPAEESLLKQVTSELSQKHRYNMEVVSAVTLLFRIRDLHWSSQGCPDFGF